MSLPIPRVEVITRSEWGASGTVPGLAPLAAPRRIVVHHTAQGYSVASRPGVTEADGRSAVRNVRHSHLQRRFADVGYHYLIDGAGRVYQGRAFFASGSLGPGRTPPRLTVGSHVRGSNSASIGVCVLGCFGGGPRDKNCDDVPSEAAVKALTVLLVALTRAYNVVPACIVGHRDLASTVCPGRHLYDRLADIRATVASAR